MLGSISFDIIIGVFLLGFIIFLLMNVISSKRNGIKVIATIKDIQEVEDVDSDGYNYIRYDIMCSCDYEGVSEAKLYYNYKLDCKNLKVGDKIDCIYDKKKRIFTTADNIAGIIIILFVMVFILALFVIFSLFPKFLNLNILN